MPHASRGPVAAQGSLPLLDTIEASMTARLFAGVYWRIRFATDREWSLQDAYNVEAHRAGIYKRQNPLKYRLYYEAVEKMCEDFDYWLTVESRHRGRDFSLQSAPRQERWYPKKRDPDWPENWQEEDPYIWDDGRHLPTFPHPESSDS